MAGLDSNTKLMLHCNGTDESTTFIDDSDSAHTVTAQGTAQLDTAYKKWGIASGWFDGNSDYLSIPDSVDWDILSNTTNDWTVDFWTRINGSGYKNWIWQSVDVTHRYGLYMSGNDYVVYYAVNGGTADSCTTTTDMDDGNWHHVALIIKGSDLGIYINGNQEAYVSRTVTGTFAVDLNIGRLHIPSVLTRYTNASIDEFRVQKSNYFLASPNSGKTDTITVPTAEYSEEAGILVPNQSIIIL